MLHIPAVPLDCRRESFACWRTANLSSGERMRNKFVRPHLLGLALLVMPMALFGRTSEAPPEIDLQWGAKIAMRDGVALNATIVRPRGQKEPLPVIFTLTPYVAD